MIWNDLSRNAKILLLVLYENGGPMNYEEVNQVVIRKRLTLMTDEELEEYRRKIVQSKRG